MQDIPAVMIIFGGSGDLAHRKLYPALFNLYEQGLLHAHFAVIATARRPWSHAFLQEQVADAIHEVNLDVDEEHLTAFASHFYYQSHDVTKVDHYVTLKNLAAKLDQKYHAQGNRVFYMAMAPRFFGTIATHINDQRLTSTGFNRIVVEKPFGRSLETAEALNRQITACFEESQIFRIDHYLSKEMIQNILPLRFANPLMRQAWNHEQIANIQVTLAERLGVEARGGYYETAGALRDMVQNHIFQIVTLLAMPEPTDPSANAVHQAKQTLLASLQLPTPEQVSQHFIRGQYAASDRTFAYRNEPNVASDSTTETYAAGQIKFTAGPLAEVPIYFRTGKALKEKMSRVDVVFKPVKSFYGEATANYLTIEFDPKNRLTLSLNGKQIKGPGLRQEAFTYALSDYETSIVPDGYERLLHDVFVNNSVNFTHWAELKRYWEFIDAIESAWQAENATGEPVIVQYPPYHYGPHSSRNIFATADTNWIYG